MALNKEYFNEVINKLENCDSFFKISYINGFAYLTVYPSVGTGKKIFVDDITKRLNLLRVKKVSPLLISEIIEKSSGKPVKIVEWPEGNIYQHEIKIILSDDLMSGSLLIKKSKGCESQLTEDDIYAALADKKIISGVNDEIIKEIIKNNKLDEEIVVAKGLFPVNGRPLQIKLFFKTERGKPFLTDNFDRINLKELDFIQNVQKGQVIGEIVEGVKGADGYNIIGTVLKSQTIKSQNLLCGSNTIMENGKILSLINGHASVISGKITVTPLIELDNVDYSTGNIYFDGAVLIKGTIFDGFIVQATGDIEVGNFIGKVEIRSGGNIILKSGINGNNCSLIAAANDIFAKYIENSLIESGGSLYIEELFLHSSAAVKGNVIMKGKRAEIIGGTIIAGGSLWCKKIGSVNGVRTIVVAGIDPDDYKELQKMEKELGELQLTQKDIVNKLKYLETHKDIEGFTPEEIEKVKIKLSINIKKNNLTIGGLSGDIQTARKNLFPENSIVVIESTIYPGSVIMFGNEEVRIQNVPVNKTIYKYHSKTLKEYGFNYRELPVIPKLSSETTD